MKLSLLDGGVIYVNPAHVVAVEAIENEDSKPIGAAVILSVQTIDSANDVEGTPLTAEVEGTAEEVAKALGIG